MTLAEQAIEGREHTLVVLPDHFQVYCTLCNVIIRPKESARKYDGTTYAHIACPSTPMKRFAPHRYL